MRRPVVLATNDYYFPGNKGGGAVQALANMAFRLGDRWGFKIVTSDRDACETAPYPSLPAGHWHQLGKAEVMYLSPVRRLWRLFALVRETKFDILYLNSFFSPVFSISLLLGRKFRLITAQRVIVAPRGDLSLSSIRRKRYKKLGYVLFAKMAGLCRDAIWHVSTAYEEAEVRRFFGRKAQVIVARDCLPATSDSEVRFPSRRKIEGRLDIVFLSRITRQKNLDGALSMLFHLRGAVRMRIYGFFGSEGDVDYWGECQAIIDRLPPNIQVEYCGALAHADVPRVMAQHHLFFLPTHSENFGFVIFEALLVGCPILISDQTPWRDLQAKGIGWELPLGEPARFHEALQACIDMDQTGFSAMSQKARAHGLQTIRDDPSVEESVMLFEAALG